MIAEKFDEYVHSQQYGSISEMVQTILEDSSRIVEGVGVQIGDEIASGVGITFFDKSALVLAVHEGSVYTSVVRGGDVVVQ